MEKLQQSFDRLDHLENFVHDKFTTILKEITDNATSIAAKNVTIVKSALSKEFQSIDGATKDLSFKVSSLSAS
jgi:hypothetical protein